MQGLPGINPSAQGLLVASLLMVSQILPALRPLPRAVIHLQEKNLPLDALPVQGLPGTSLTAQGLQATNLPMVSPIILVLLSLLRAVIHPQAKSVLSATLPVQSPPTADLSHHDLRAENLHTAVQMVQSLHSALPAARQGPVFPGNKSLLSKPPQRLPPPCHWVRGAWR